MLTAIHDTKTKDETIRKLLEEAEIIEDEHGKYELIHVGELAFSSKMFRVSDARVFLDPKTYDVWEDDVLLVSFPKTGRILHWLLDKAKWIEHSQEKIWFTKMMVH